MKCEKLLSLSVVFPVDGGVLILKFSLKQAEEKCILLLYILVKCTLMHT